MPDFMRLDPLADIGFHAMPALMLTIDLLFFSPPWTIAALPAMGVSAVLAFSYWFWVELCYRQNGWYVSVLQMLGRPNMEWDLQFWADIRK